MANLTTNISARGSKGHHTFQLVITEVATSIENNTSDISYQFIIKDGNGWDWYGWGDKIKYSVVIDGNTISGTISQYVAYSTTTLKSGTLYGIKHDTSGAKTLSFSFNVTDGTGQSYTCGSASAAGTLVLTQLHKAPSISDCILTEENTSLKTLGVKDDEIVPYMSKKKFKVTAEMSDGATLKKVKVYNQDNSFSGENTTDTVTIDLKDKNFTYGYDDFFKRIMAQLYVEVIDNKDASSRIVYPYNTVIPYFTPNIEATNSNIRRKTDSQTSLTDNKATIIIKGSFYKSGDVIGNNNSITVQYKVWEDGASEPTDYSTILTGITRDGNNITVNYDLININYVKKYHYKLLLKDKYNYLSNEVIGDIPIGVALWTEYKDRVDFLNATIKGENLYGGREVAQLYVNNNKTYTDARWSNPEVIFDGMNTTNSNYFTKNGNRIKVTKAGTYLVLFSCSMNTDTTEFDVVLWCPAYTRKANYSNSPMVMHICNLKENEEVYVKLNNGNNNFTIYSADLVLIKLI